jgi:NhaP-type Na+/H+ or K+/H+ antiporter
VALAVALSLPASVQHSSLLVTMTFGVVLFTIVIQGVTVEPLARRLGVLPSLADGLRPMDQAAQEAAVVPDQE